MDDTRKCARCPKTFSGDVGFVTCPACRLYHPEHGKAGGCRFWEGAAVDPRVTRRDVMIDTGGQILRVK